MIFFFYIRGRLHQLTYYVYLKKGQVLPFHFGFNFLMCVKRELNHFSRKYFPDLHHWYSLCLGGVFLNNYRTLIWKSIIIIVICIINYALKLYNYLVLTKLDAIKLVSESHL
uniref:Uncharacterized protein n=1 Tax=Cacopsylla melanoneura TaxID=428564 RepID=A0A8D9B3V8_9HEMI